MMLARLGPRIYMEFWYLVSDEDHDYFLGISKEARQKEFAMLAYHTRRASTIMELKASKRGKALLPDRL